jgi:hypothetical protein
MLSCHKGDRKQKKIIMGSEQRLSFQRWTGVNGLADVDQMNTLSKSETPQSPQSLDRVGVKRKSMEI